jgi:predicted nucleic acid-binding protein
MNGKSFFDTNVLIYAAIAGDARAVTARALLETGGVVGVQQLNEFVAIAQRKLKRTWEEIREKLSDICVLCPTPVPITLEVHETALQIAQRYGYGIYDSLSIAAALSSGCDTFYSEDLQDSQEIDRIVIRNPFREGHQPQL